MSIYLQVRDTVVRYMAANKAEFEPYLGEDWRRYINDMATEATWGDELTLVCKQKVDVLNVHWKGMFDASDYG